MESTGASYMDFEPYCVWHREEGTDTLAVHLHGFKKEQIRVQVNNHRMLTIHGQHPLDETKLSRFNKQIKLPDDCIEDGIRAKFVGGILTITMAKRSSSSLSSPQEASSTRKTDEKSSHVNDTTKQQIKDDESNKDKEKWISGMLKITTIILVLTVFGAYINCVYKKRSCVES